MVKPTSLAPADKRIYATRDIIASILAKKLEGGLDGLIIDDEGGLQRPDASLARSEALAQTIVGVASVRAIE